MAQSCHRLVTVATVEFGDPSVILEVRSNRGERLASVSERSAMAIQELDLERAPSRRDQDDDGQRPLGGPLQLFVTGAVIIVPFVGALLAITGLIGERVAWFDLGLLVAGYVVTVLGVTAGYHRLFTHRSFVAVRPLKIALAVLGSFALQGSLVDWVTTHRRHHQYSDRPGDPHSPVSPTPRSQWAGLLHAHVGWLFRVPAPARRRDAADLLIDRDLRVVSGLFPLFAALTLAVPFFAGWVVAGTVSGAVTALIWGGLVRIFLAHHLTWSINSVCHMVGKRPFRTTDQSRNVGALALLSMGESWHNAHHAFPTLARHGVDRHQVDLTAACIRAWERLGLVHSVHWPDVTKLALRRIPVIAPSGA
jgi:stearoyl-CoA desaturase (delta-9 desaturase)